MFSENQFSAVSTLHPSDHFPLHDGDILSEFSVCWGKWKKKKKKCSYPLSFIQSHFWFFNRTSYIFFPVGSDVNRTLQESVSGFPGACGARTSSNPMGTQCLVDGKARLISSSNSSSSLASTSLYEINPHGLLWMSSSSQPSSVKNSSFLLYIQPGMKAY